MNGTLRHLLPGIREKLIAAFSLLVAAIAVLVFVLLPARLEKQSMHAAIARAETIRDMTAYSLSAALVFEDTMAVGEVLAGAARDSDVVELWVFNAHDRLVSLHRATNAGTSDRDAEIRDGVSRDGTRYVTSTDVRHGRSRVGTLTDVLSLEPLRRETQSARQLGLMLGLLIFVLGIGVVYAISTLVTRPLSALSTIAGHIAAGNLSHRATETADAEIAQFVRAFNGMVGSLEHAQQDWPRPTGSSSPASPSARPPYLAP